MLKRSATALAFAALGSSLALAACGSDVSQAASSSGSTGKGAGGEASSTTAGNGGAQTGSSGTAVGGASSSSSNSSAMGGSSSVSATTTSSSSSASASSSGSGNGSSSSGPSCPGFGDACSDCAAQKCPDTYCVCYGSLACEQLDTCLNNCPAGNMGCYQMCFTVYKDGISSATLLSDCAAGSCGAECPKAKTLTGCQKCLYQKCDTQMNNCIANAECTALISCVNACNPADMACSQACVAAHSSGLADAQAVNMCLKANCQGTCP
jgi:hypothetical protein